MALSKKQKAFVEYYLQCWNATEAAKEAGYSEKTARQQGSRLLTKVDILQHIQARLEELKMSSDEVLIRLSEQARGDMGEFIGKNLAQLAKHPKSRLIKKIRRKTIVQGDRTITEDEIELYDSQNALIQMGRFHKLFTDKLIVDWRSELEEAGIDPDAIKERLIRAIADQQSGD